MNSIRKKKLSYSWKKDFPIKMYMRGPPHEPYYIALILQEQIIVEPTEKLVISYVVRDLALLD